MYVSKTVLPKPYHVEHPPVYCLLLSSDYNAFNSMVIELNKLNPVQYSHCQLYKPFH